jgi:hypothetical protein
MTPFCVVLACWGRAYSSAYINALTNSAFEHSPDLAQVILLTDAIKKDINPCIVQKTFPIEFNRDEFFGYGYRVKISVFSKSILPKSMPCIYIDLDTVIIGDLGRIARLVRDPEDIFMMPPGDLLGFGVIRRLISRITKNRKFGTGNSSVIAFHSASGLEIAENFIKLFKSGLSGRHMTIDDVYISWASQNSIKSIPKTMAVMFRREFLARTEIGLWLKSNIPFRAKSRNNLVLITFNGTSYKPEKLLALRMGQRIEDPKGRFGYWSEYHIGPVLDKIIQYCKITVDV